MLAAVALLAIAVLPAAVAAPTRAAETDGAAPRLYVQDASVTRNADVRLGFIVDYDPDLGAGGVIGRVASNDPAVADGLLVNGTPVGELSTWTLAAGPDGPRTIYGQVQYESGLWSPVGSIDLVLDLDPRSAMAFDVDDRAMYWASEATDWHTSTTSPGTRVSASGSADGSRDMVSVGDGSWGLVFVTPGAVVEPGTYVIPAPGEVTSTTPLAIVSPVGPYGPNSSCEATGGTVTVEAVTFAADGDVFLLDADFRLECGEAVMGGSIRYGSDRPLRALDVGEGTLAFPITTIGRVSEPATEVFTNHGSLPVTFGQARVAGANPSDFAIREDGCSGETLAVGDSCSVSLTFSPTGIENRFGRLVIPDDTPAGRRSVLATAYGRVQTIVVLGASGVPTFGPGPATVTATVTPADAPAPYVGIDGLGARVVGCPPGPAAGGSRVYTCAVMLGAGPNAVYGSVSGQGGYLPATATPLELSVGTRTSLALSTITDDGVANGESAMLRAQLWTGGPVAGGTLRIIDGETDAVLASAAVSGTAPSLEVEVTRSTGTHPFTAEFVPSTADVQASDAAYELVVVTGTRPQTVMPSSTVFTGYDLGHSTFTSPDADVTFECRVGGSSWYACTSPGTYRSNDFGPDRPNVMQARAVRANGLADRTPASRPWIIDVGAPQAGTIRINDGRTYTRSRMVQVAIAGGSDTVGLAGVGLSNTLSVVTPPAGLAATRSWTLSTGDGTKTVYAYWVDVADNHSTPALDTIVLDTIAPATSGPRPFLRAATTVTDGRLRVRLDWAASDGTSGIARFELGRSLNGGPWKTISSDTRDSYADRWLSPGTTYRFRVRAVDRAGNTGAWATGPSFRLSAAQQGSAAIAYVGVWRTSRAGAWWGGTSRSAIAPGAKATIRVTARSFAWVSATGPGRGVARVYVNGGLVATVDLGAATTTPRRVVFAKTWPSAQARTITVRVSGTAGRPRVDLDGFAWAR